MGCVDSLGCVVWLLMVNGEFFVTLFCSTTLVLLSGGRVKSPLGATRRLVGSFVPFVPRHGNAGPFQGSGHFITL